MTKKTIQINEFGWHNGFPPKLENSDKMKVIWKIGRCPYCKNPSPKMVGWDNDRYYCDRCQ